MLPRLSTDLDDPDAQPYFIWDVPVTVRELRELLHHQDEATRALWTGRVLREARYADVWRFLTLAEVVERFPIVRRHLGRRRPFWEFLIDGWRSDGLLPESAWLAAARSGEATLVAEVVVPVNAVSGEVFREDLDRQRALRGR